MSRRGQDFQQAEKGSLAEKGLFGQRLGRWGLGTGAGPPALGLEGAAGLALLVGGGWSVCLDLRSAAGLKPHRAGLLLRQRKQTRGF